MVRPSVDLGQLSQWGVAVVVAVVTSSAPAKAVPVVSVDATALANCRSIETRLPTQSELETLQALVQKYKVAEPDVAIDKTALTRCQFASHLSALLDQVNEVIASGMSQLVPQADLFVFQQLQAAYAVELRSLSEFSAASEARAVTPEEAQFATTVKLNSGEDFLEGLPKDPPRLPDSAAPAVLADRQALQALMERYDSTVQYFRRSAQLDRFEFALTLHTFEHRLERLVATGTVISQAVLTTLHQLETAYAAELVYVRVCLDQLDQQLTRRLARQQYSTPVKLTSGEGMSLADFEAGYRQALTEAAALALFRGQVDDPVKGSTLMTLQLSNTAKLSSMSFLSPQPPPLSFSLDALLTSTKPPAPRTFAPTTTLHVETVLEVSGTAGNR